MNRTMLQNRGRAGSCLHKALAVMLGLVVAHGAAAQSIRVGAGAQLQLGDGQIRSSCLDLAVDGNADLGAARVSGLRDVRIAGRLALGSGSLAVAGDWSNAGTFSAGTSEVVLQDGCARSSARIEGNSSFHRLRATTASGRTLVFGAGTTQQVAANLTLAGSAGKLLTIRSAGAGAAGHIDLAAAAMQSVAWVDVMDNHGIGQRIAPGRPAAFNSVDSGNSTGWFQNGMAPADPPKPVPTLSRGGLLALLVALLLLARRSPAIARKSR